MATRSVPRRAAGFSLIELMIVVAIIGILASIVIPNFLTFRCKARATEAQSILGTLKHFQTVYLSENDEYFCPTDSTDLSALANAGFDFSRVTYHVLYLTCSGPPRATAPPWRVCGLAPVDTMISGSLTRPEP